MSDDPTRTDEPSDEDPLRLPEDEADSQLETENEADGTEQTVGNLEAGTVSGPNSTLAGVIENQTINHFDNEQSEFFQNLDEKVARGVRLRPAKLAKEHFHTFSQDDATERSEHIVARPDEVDRLSGLLGAHRILLLEGPAGLGKGMLAMKVAFRLCQELELQQVQRCRITITRQLAIDLQSLVAKTQEMHDSVIVLDNAFQHENEDLTRFGQGTDTIALAAYEQLLAEARAFLIVTIDCDRRPQLHPALQERLIQAMGPTRQQLRDFFETQAQRRIDQGDHKEKAQEALERLLREEGDRVVDFLATIPRIESFVHSQLALLVEDPEISLESALQQTDRLDRWLLEEQARDLQALTCVLAMAVCHAGPAGWPVRWFHFDHLRRALLTHLREVLHQSEEEIELEEVCRAPELLRRLRIEIIPGSDGAGDIVRFLDEDRSEKLWACLLGEGRSISALLVPKLTELATGGEFYLRQHAGWSLGRISRLDPYGVFGRLFYSWSQDPSRADALGTLTVGALASGDQGLNRLCRHRVRATLQDPRFERVEACTLALGEIGQLDLELALDELRRVIRNRLMPRLEYIRNGERERRQAETKIHKQTRSSALRNVVSNVHDLALEKELKESMLTMFRPNLESRVLGSCQFTLTGLCFEHGAHAVLAQLMRWMPASKEAELGPMLALLFIRPDGVFDILERYSLHLEEDNAEGETWSRVLVSASLAENGLDLLADFLFGLYLGTSAFPKAFSRALLNKWLALVERWTRQAAEGQIYRDQVIQLWCLLLQLPDLELRHRLRDLLDLPELSVLWGSQDKIVADIRQRHADMRQRSSLPAPKTDS